MAQVQGTALAAPTVVELSYVAIQGRRLTCRFRASLKHKDDG